MADLGIQIIASQRSDGKFDLSLEMQGIEPILLQGEVASPEDALRLIYDALTAPLADADKLKTLDELSTQVQSMVDELGNAIERLSQLEQRVSGVDVLSELAKLTESLRGGGGGGGGDGTPTRPTLRQQQPSGPDRGLRRKVMVPHEAVGGAVPRHEVTGEHGEG